MKPILFIDFYKTLNHESYWRSLPAKLYKKVQEFLFGTDRTVIRDWMVGKYTAKEVNKIVSEKLNIPFDYLWNVFVEDCRTMHVPKEILEKIDTLRSKFTLILITVNMDSFDEFTTPALGLEKYFDYISNSFNEKIHKNHEEGKLFLKYAEKFGAPIEKCFLLDDSKPVCETFKALGGTAYQVTNEKDVNYYLNVLIKESV